MQLITVLQDNPPENIRRDIEKWFLGQVAMSYRGPEGKAGEGKTLLVT